MLVRFAKAELGRLEAESGFTAGFHPDIVTAYRKRLQQLRSVTDERDLYALRSLHFKKLKGDRSHQRSVRLNDQWRLIIEVEEGTTGNTLVLIGIEDYH